MELSSLGYYLVTVIIGIAVSISGWMVKWLLSIAEKLKTVDVNQQIILQRLSVHEKLNAEKFEYITDQIRDLHNMIYERSR